MNTPLSIDEKALLIAIRTDRTTALMTAFNLLNNPRSNPNDASGASLFVAIERIAPPNAEELAIIEAIRSGERLTAVGLLLAALDNPTRSTRNQITWSVRPLNWHEPIPSLNMWQARRAPLFPFYC